MDHSPLFPEENYTPFGVLDNPWHSWKDSRSGVFRTHPALGIEWLYPNAQTSDLVISIRLALRIGGQWVVDAGDFRKGNCELFSPHHSKNLQAIALLSGGRLPLVEWFVPSAETLAFRLHPPAGPVQELGLGMEAKGGTNAGLWEYGWAGRPLDESGVLLRRFAEGPTFATVLSAPLSIRIAPGPLSRRGFQIPSWGEAESCATVGNDPIVAYGRFSDAVPESALWGVLAKGKNEREAIYRAKQMLQQLPSRLRQLLSEDEAFWSRAPRLEGDWPDHWKRGWVVDFETLRMVIRPPIGIFKHPWDGMQIQKPRVVLAESMLDSWAMSFADASLAEEVILGTFSDALAPNIPCAREDGSTNMIAADGSECGTSPAWCLPLTAIREMLRMTRNRAWAEQLFPYLEKYVNWWIKNRTDADGWAFYKCSWESGQDSSPKFLIEQPTGAELTSHLRAVDLQAGLLDAVETLLEIAETLGRSRSRWKAVYSELSRRLRKMWHAEAFRDFDRRTGEWVISQEPGDLTNLTPFAVVDWPPEIVAASKTRFESFFRQPESWLEWPSFFLAYAAALARTGQWELLSRVVDWRADLTYRAWDRRDWDGFSPVPGVAAECWGLGSPRGAEGYGWGATLPLHILRGLLGLKAAPLTQEAILYFRPNLPNRFLRTGAEYRVEPLAFAGAHLDLVVRVEKPGELVFELIPLGGALDLQPAGGRFHESLSGGGVRWYLGNRGLVWVSVEEKRKALARHPDVL